MNKEEEKLLLREAIYDYVHSTSAEISALSEKCFSFAPQSFEFLRLSSKLSGLVSTNSWFTNNSSCESITELKKRVQCFHEILVDSRNVSIEKKMTGACYASLYPMDYEKCEKAMSECGFKMRDVSSLKIQQKGVQFFQDALEEMKRFLDDKEIKSKEKECHFQIYSGQVREDWTEVDYYKMIQANHECYYELKKFCDAFEQKPYVSQSMR